MPLPSADLASATQPREESVYLQQREREALALLYNDVEKIRGYISPISPKEDPAKLQWRRTATVNFCENFLMEIAQTYIEQIYKTKEVRRETGIAELDKYLAGCYDAQFQNEIAPLALALPELYLYADVPPTISPIKTKYDARVGKAWPRITPVMPSAITGKKESVDGDLEWICRKLTGTDEQEFYEIRDTSGVRTIDADGNAVPRLRDSDGMAASQAPHGLYQTGVVPCIFKRNHARGGSIGEAFLHPVCRKTLAGLQITARIVEMSAFHFHQQLVMDADTYKATKDEGGTGNATAIIEPPANPGESRTTTHYLQRDASIIDALMNWCYKIYPASIYRTARLRDRTTDQHASGYSKMLDTVPELAALASVANFLREIDHRCVMVIAKSYDPSISDEDIKVTYPKTFDLKTGQERIAELASIANLLTTGGMPISPTAIREMMEDMYTQQLPDRGQAIYAQMKKELDEWMTRYAADHAQVPVPEAVCEAATVAGVAEPS